MNSIEERTNRLREAAHRKTVDAARRANVAIDDLVANRQDVTFRAVARHGHVSIDFLYRNPDVRQRIADLRASFRIAPNTEPRAVTDSAVAQALTLHIRKLRDENRELRSQVAALHGELLTLRRTAAGHPGPASPDANDPAADALLRTPSATV